MEDYDTPDDFAEEINTAARKRKALEADKTKTTKKTKWKSGEIDTLIDELEEQSCLWDVFVGGFFGAVSFVGSARFSSGCSFCAGAHD